MFTLGGLEILVLCSIIGGVVGVFFRDKKRRAWVGFVLGVAGAILTSLLLVEFVWASYIALPVYAVLGSWLFNWIFKKLSDKNSV